MVQSVEQSFRRPAAGAARARRRAEARRLEILRAAAGIFRSRGFAAAGMRDIAVAADLSPGNLYTYFRGKDEILFFCQDRTLDRLLAALAARAGARHAVAATSVGSGRSSALHALAVAHVLCLVDDVDGSAAHLEVDALPLRLRAAIVAKRDRYERGVRALIAGGIRRGELGAADRDRRDARVSRRAQLDRALVSTERTADSRRDRRMVADYAVRGLGAGG